MPDPTIEITDKSLPLKLQGLILGISDFLKLIPVPPTLQGLEHAMVAINSLRKYAPLIELKKGDKVRLPSAETIDGLITEVRRLDIAHTLRSTNNRGLIETNPVWAALLQYNPTADDYIHWNHLCITLISIALYDRIKYGELKKIGAGVSSACLAIRKLYKGNTSLPLLPKIPRNKTTVSNYREYVLDLRATLDKDNTAPSNLILTLLNQYTSNKDKIERKGGERSRLERSTKQLIADSSDKISNEPVSSVISRESNKSGEALATLKHHGIIPEELQIEKTVEIAYAETGRHQLNDSRSRYMRQKSQIKHISKLNQRLPYRYNCLTDTEAAKTIRHSIRAISNSHRRTVKAHIMILITSLFSRDIEELKALKIYRTRENLPKARSDSFSYLLKESCFHITIKTPEWKTTLEGNQRKLLHEFPGSINCVKDGSITVAAPHFLRTKMSELFQHKLANEKSFVNFCSTEERDQIDESVKELIRQSSPNKRATLDRLRAYGFDQILKATNDDYAVSHMLTSQPFTISETSKHYVSIDAKQLLSIITNSIENTLDRAGFAERLNNYQHEPEGDLGSQLNLKPSLVKTYVDHLKLGLANAKRQPPSTSKIVEIHNAFALYISVWIIYETGYRSVNDLIFSLSEIDITTGLVVISDKDDESSFNTRLSYVSSALRNQVQKYLIHLTRLREIFIHDDEIASSIYDLVNAETPVTPLLFFLGSKRKKVIRVSPASIEQNFPEHALPLNANRHFLSSELRKRGAIPEYIDCFMGHWQIGQEPHNRYSSVCPMDMIISIHPFLDAIRKDCGWSLLSGLADG